MTIVLEAGSLSKSFGGAPVVDQVSLGLAGGIRQALIGPNGAGKTTLVNLLTGTLAPSGGRVVLEGRDVTALPVHARVRLGLTRTFQISQLFHALTPLEAVTLAVLQREGLALSPWRSVESHGRVVEEAGSLLRRLHLWQDRGEPTEQLPYGRQRLLELALALAGRPRVLLLDEPAAGVPPEESGEILDTVARLPREVTVLLIEHDMDLVFRFAERITVLVGGRILTEDEPARVAADPRVREVYLGDGADG